MRLTYCMQQNSMYDAMGDMMVTQFGQCVTALDFPQLMMYLLLTKNYENSQLNSSNNRNKKIAYSKIFISA